jgi:hypothetical protein
MISGDCSGRAWTDPDFLGIDRWAACRSIDDTFTETHLPCYYKYMAYINYADGCIHSSWLRCSILAVLQCGPHAL